MSASKNDLASLYESILKASQTKVKVVQGGQVLDVGGVLIPRTGAIASRTSIRRR